MTLYKEIEMAFRANPVIAFPNTLTFYCMMANVGQVTPTVIMSSGTTEFGGGRATAIGNQGIVRVTNNDTVARTVRRIVMGIRI